MKRFIAACFEQCLRALDELDKLAGPSGFSVLYRNLCQQYLREPPVAETFNGTVVLTEK